MGVMIEGNWHDQWYDTANNGGRFVRPDSQFRHWVTAQGQAGPTGDGGFRAEAGRYHLYVSLACPWAQRTLIYRRLKGLETAITLSVVHWRMLEHGWNFAPGPGVISDPLHAADYLYEVYRAADPHYSGRVTVPVLWDRQTHRIVNNESADIIRMFNTAFDGVGATAGDFYPVALRPHIDALNARIYDTLNNGVYRAGFATTQGAYEEAVGALFATLDALEAQLGVTRYLLGDAPTEADWRLLPTLLRFDAVYVGHFKCNLRRLADYPNLAGYTRDLYQWPGVAETFNLEHAKRHYFESHAGINPSGIVPLGPLLDFHAPHTRAHGV
ncbi:MAG: glutathione S-transferase family protein [Gammaproteobacteria bacterium]|nr:glutathione S-transferase family protein [Gammaproteobacteria bacterium]